MGQDAEAQQWVRDYVAMAGSQAHIDEFVGRVDTAILAELPELAGDPVLTADLHASTRSQFQIFLSLLERPQAELLLPPQAVDLALSIARRQLELGVLLKVYRVASGAVWDYFTEITAAVPDDGPDRTEVLVYLWSHGGTWINGAVEQLIGVFYAEREASLQGALARRSETVHALLRGDQVGIDDAISGLDHPVREVHTAVVLWTDDPTALDVLPRFTALASAVAAAVDAKALTVPAGRGEIWSWLTARSAVRPAAVVEAIEQACQDPTLRAAIGTPLPGIPGLRDSHREAVEAQRHAALTSTTGRCTVYADVELACLVAGNEAGARRLVLRELGRLSEDDPAMERIRETVATYLALGASVEQAATQLFVHKNTVRYRLGQAEELLGHPLTERRTEIALALACRDRVTAGWA